MNKKNNIDLGKTSITKLYMKILIPTILGMISLILVIITDGYFVGKYVGSDAMASVNFASPIYNIAEGFALMFGLGCSIMVSISLSQKKVREANLSFNQVILVSTFLFVIVSIIIALNSQNTASLLGCSDKLLSSTASYIKIIAVALPFFIIMNLGLFMIRLDGSPKFAMFCSVAAAVINAMGDYLLVGRLGVGLDGAAYATSAGFIVGGIMSIIYTLFFSYTLKFISLKKTLKKFLILIKNITHICKLGFSGLLNQLSLALMAIIGNSVFLTYLQEDGVAAFSVTCFYFPIVFMINNAIAQSAQPIISYNIGINQIQRSKQTYHLSIRVAFVFGLLITLLMCLGASKMTGLFLVSSNKSYQIAVEGIPYFAIGYIFFAINIVYIGYLQSIGRVLKSNIFILLRGYLFLSIFFLTLPLIMGKKGIWLAMPFAEIMTTIIIGIIIFIKKDKPKIS